MAAAWPVKYIWYQTLPTHSAEGLQFSAFHYKKRKQPKSGSYKKCKSLVQKEMLLRYSHAQKISIKLQPQYITECVYTSFLTKNDTTATDSYS